MAVLEDVEVHITSSRTEQDLVEYDDPNPEAPAKEKEVKKFIEVVPDDEFFVKVKLMAGFDYHGADGVCIYLTIDENVVDCYWYRALDVKSIYCQKLTKDVFYDRRTVPAKRGNGWVDVAFAFGEAKIGKCRADLWLKWLRCSI